MKGTDYLMHMDRAWYLQPGTPGESDAARSWFSANCMSRAAKQRIAVPLPEGMEEAAPLEVEAPAEPAPGPESRAEEAPAAPAPVTAAAPEWVPPAPPPASANDLFIAGYRAAGGPEAHLSRIVNRVIPCESSGNPNAYSTVGPFYGLMQFLGATWEAVGGGDWRDPYQQGANTARLLARANPATQWPVCWFK